MNNTQWENGHNEDWYYRVNLYGDLFDSLFNCTNSYKTKRSECHNSQTIKSMREAGSLDEEERYVKLNFIYKTFRGVEDVFFREDKPRMKPSKNDMEKANALRRNTLIYWSKLLVYLECSKHFVALSCHFSRSKLRVTATKLIDKSFIVVWLKEASIPNSTNNTAALADFMATVINLKDGDGQL
ncbi:hypothetical protein MUCCIDRAFT_107899 [Mucor lusitanicus CBS 277.49]|uniref:Uncharacterized protein n=1 Tax=Mucor lusitanicus CBS 277.49 TaxID=747725 RepID=A0A168P7P1_MUCCL|nr:hypothetical protein MUCCIDRAFT_107899 [Mucor lusitanicus CBS 277.49]